MNQSGNYKKPLISIITAVYNAETTLQRTIDSIAPQMDVDVEYIVVDGGSTDGTLDIIKRNSATITKWVSEADGGIYDAFNKGIKMANGILVGIINGDDWYESDTFSLVKQDYLTHPEADIYYGLARFWNADGILMAVQGHTDSFLSYGMICHPTCFVNKRVYENIAMFDTRYKIAADYNLMITLKETGCKFHFIEKVLANFNEGGISTTKIFDLKNELADIKKAHHLISRKQYHLEKFQLKIKKALGAL